MTLLPVPSRPIETATEFVTILRALERRQDAAADLIVPVLAAVAEALVHGRGPATPDQLGFLPTIDGPVETVRHVLLAGAGPVTRAEADLLFQMHRFAPGLAGDAEWDDLFIGAVAHHLADASGHAVKPRNRSLTAAAGLTRVRIATEPLAWLRRRAGPVPTDAERALLAYAAPEPSEYERAGLALTA